MMGLKEVFDEIWDMIKNDIKKEKIENCELKYHEMVRKWLIERRKRRRLEKQLKNDID